MKTLHFPMKIQTSTFLIIQELIRSSKKLKSKEHRPSGNLNFFQYQFLCFQSNCSEINFFHQLNYYLHLTYYKHIQYLKLSNFM